MGTKHDPVPPNIFLEMLFKPSVVWQDESGNPIPDLVIPQKSKHNFDIIGGSTTEITPSAHLIMAVIAPWTEPFLAYLNGESSMWTKRRLAALFGARKPTRSMTESSTRKVLPESFKGVSPKKRDGSS